MSKKMDENRVAGVHFAFAYDVKSVFGVGGA
jgi:hypothetical protein